MVIAELGPHVLDDVVDRRTRPRCNSPAREKEVRAHRTFGLARISMQLVEAAVTREPGQWEAPDVQERTQTTSLSRLARRAISLRRRFIALVMGSFPPR